jgi:hypothetical protein
MRPEHWRRTERTPPARVISPCCPSGLVQWWLQWLIPITGTRKCMRIAPRFLSSRTTAKLPTGMPVPVRLCTQPTWDTLLSQAFWEGRLRAHPPQSCPPCRPRHAGGQASPNWKTRTTQVWIPRWRKRSPWTRAAAPVICAWIRATSLWTAPCWGMKCGLPRRQNGMPSMGPFLIGCNLPRTLTVGPQLHPVSEPLVHLDLRYIPPPLRIGPTRRQRKSTRSRTCTTVLPPTYRLRTRKTSRGTLRDACSPFPSAGHSCDNSFQTTPLSTGKGWCIFYCHCASASVS